MHETLAKRVQEAERIRNEELEALRIEEEMERKRIEEEDERKRAEEFAFYQLKDKIEKSKQVIDKKRYCGAKIEPNTQYYQIMMRKKERQ